MALAEAPVGLLDHEQPIDGAEFQPRDDVDYDLTPEKVAAGIQALEDYAQESEVLTGSRQLYVAHGLQTGTDVGRTLEREVFTGAFGNTSDVMHVEYNPYEENSVFFMVYDHEEGRLVGVVRGLEGFSFDSFKTLNDLQDPAHVPPEALRDRGLVIDSYGLEIPSTIDVATLAIPEDLQTPQKSFRSAEIQGALYHAIYDYSVNNSVSRWVSVIDPGAKRIYNKMNMPWEPILGVEPFNYLDSEKSLAVIMDVTQMEDAMIFDDSAPQRFYGGLAQAMIYGTPLPTRGTPQPTGNEVVT